MEKKRIRPNLILLVLVAAVAVSAYWISHQDSDTVAVTTPRSIVIEIADVAPEMLNAVGAGDLVTETTKNQVLGTVTAVEALPYYESVYDEEAGICRRAEVSGRICLMVTLQADTIDTDSAVNAASGFALRVGTGVNCTVGKRAGVGHIVGVER